jgi:GT2 family glycosyltransferase
MPRPRVDVVVPFRGSVAKLEELQRRLAGLELGAGDTVVIVDNTGGRSATTGRIAVIARDERASPGYSRNQGAAHGSAPWIVFIDADTEPVPDLLERYFDPPPASETALLAGGVIDEPVDAAAPGPARVAHLRRTLHQDRTLAPEGDFAFAQAANIACRRTAFEATGGFREDIRAGEDADFSFRLRATGGRIERREAAAVVHRNRRTVRAFLAQASLHGAGAAWVDRNYPGAFPRRRRPGLLWWGARTALRGCARFARSRDRDELICGIYEPLWVLAFEFGRSRSVEVKPDRRGTLRRR